MEEREEPSVTLAVLESNGLWVPEWINPKKQQNSSVGAARRSGCVELRWEEMEQDS